MTDPIKLVVKQYAGKQDGKHQYNTIGYVDPDKDGHNKLKLVIGEIERVIAERRDYAMKNGKPEPETVYLDVFSNEPRKEKTHAAKVTEQREAQQNGVDEIPF